MLRKVFIVARHRPDVYASLQRVLQGEDDVHIIFDRRAGAPPGGGRGSWREFWSSPDPPLLEERRHRTDIDDDIRRRGFGVVRLDPDDVAEDGAEDDIAYDDAARDEEPQAHDIEEEPSDEEDEDRDEPRFG